MVTKEVTKTFSRTVTDPIKFPVNVPTVKTTITAKKLTVKPVGVLNDPVVVELLLRPRKLIGISAKLTTATKDLAMIGGNSPPTPVNRLVTKKIKTLV